MGPRLVGLAAILARRQGAAAAQALLRKGNAWMADPGNDAARQALVEQLRVGAEKAGGTAARLAARLAKEIDKRRVSVGAWERDLMALRYEVADMAPGPVRDAALDAYAAQVSAAVHLIGGAGNPARAAGRCPAGPRRRGADAAPASAWAPTSAAGRSRRSLAARAACAAR